MIFGQLKDSAFLYGKIEELKKELTEARNALLSQALDFMVERDALEKELAEVKTEIARLHKYLRWTKRNEST